MKKFIFLGILTIAAGLPALSLAFDPNAPGAYGNDGGVQVVQQQGIGSTQTQCMGRITDINSLACKIANIGNLATYLFIALAVIYIIWNVVMHFIKDSSDDRAEAAQSIMYGIVGLFIILSLWGLVNILIGTFGTNNNAPTDRFPNANFLNK